MRRSPCGLVLVAALAVAGTAGSQPLAARVQTVVTVRGWVQALSADSGRVAWMGRRCLTVFVRPLGRGRTVTIGDARASGCDTRSAPQLALAGERALWMLRDNTGVQHEFVVTSSVRRKKARVLEVAEHGVRAAGKYVTGLAGDGPLLVYSSVTVAETGGAFSVVAGSVQRVVGRRAQAIETTTPPALIAAAAGRVAVAPAETAARPKPVLRPKNGGPIQVLDARTGRVVSQAVARGTILAIALSGRHLAVLTQRQKQQRVELFAVANGAAIASVVVPDATAPELVVASGRAIFHAGRRIGAVDTRGGVRTLATAAADPLGVSLDGKRVYWAENTKAAGKARARIRSVRLVST